MTMPIRSTSNASENQKMRQPGKVRTLTKGEIAKEYPSGNSKKCLLCPRKAAPGSAVCTACFHQQFPMVEHPRVCGKLKGEAKP